MTFKFIFDANMAFLIQKCYYNSLFLFIGIIFGKKLTFVRTVFSIREIAKVSKFFKTIINFNPSQSGRRHFRRRRRS